MLRELRAHFEKWRILGYFLAKFPLEKPKITILTYNCAHLKSTKESVTFEYIDIYFAVLDSSIGDIVSH